MSITTEQLSRLEQMCEPGQQTWDLSPNDVAAIRAALERIKTLEGKSLDYFAGQALQGLVASGKLSVIADRGLNAEIAYLLAEAMIKEREKHVRKT